MTSLSNRSDALTWFGFHEDPFAVDPDTRYFVSTPTHDRALAYCQRIIPQHIGMGLVYGGPGTGKTMVARQLERSLVDTPGEQEFVVHFADGATLGRSPDTLLRDICRTLGAPKRVPNYRLYDAIEDAALKLLQNQTVTVLLVDRAECLENALLQSLVLLWNLVTPNGSSFLLRIVIFARPTILRALDHPKHEALKSRLALGSPKLTPLDRDALATLVEQRIALAGGQAGLFTPEALDLLLDASGGLPGSALALASGALDLAFVAGEKSITADSIKRGVEEAPPCVA